MKRAAVSLSIIFAALCPSAARADDLDELPFLVPRPNVTWFESATWTPVNPDADAFARWPLPAGKHPSLAPAYPVAAALAQPGVQWLSLCDRGAQLRLGVQKDLAEYLHAWCDVARREPDAALARLAPLMRTAKPALRDAIRIDVASILVDHGPADLAMRALTRARISSVDVYDTIVTAFEAAITARRCTDPAVDNLRTEALRYAAQKLHDRSYDKRLDVIVRPFTLCRSQ